MFHQALGLGAVRYVENHEKNYEVDLGAKLSIVLHLLLPKASEGDILKAASKFITKAIALKTAMIKEQAVYQCYWAYSGDQFDIDAMDIADEERGPVYLCT